MRCAGVPSTQRIDHTLTPRRARAGQVRRRPAERPRRVRVVGPHAQGVGRVEQRVPPDADRAHELCAAPASSRTARRSLVDAARNAGPVRRRPAERPRHIRLERRHAQGMGPVERSMPPHADRAHEPCAAPASSRHNASIARRRRDGRRSCASSPCRTAASCPGRATARSRCGKMSRGRWHVWLLCAGLRRISPDVSSPRSSRTVGLFRFRVSASRWHGV